jgi:hypothetical protein
MIQTGFIRHHSLLRTQVGSMLISVGEQHLPDLNEQLQMWYSDIIAQNLALAERYSQRR